MLRILLLVFIISFVSWFIRQRYFLCEYHLLHFCVNLLLSLCFLHFCVFFLRYSTLKMYFCSEIYQRVLARLAYMTDIKDFFIASNTVHNAPGYDSNVLSTLVQTVEAFARVTYQSVYLIDWDLCKTYHSFNFHPYALRCMTIFWPTATVKIWDRQIIWGAEVSINRVLIVPCTF